MKTKMELRTLPTPPPEKVLIVEMSLKEAALLRNLVYSVDTRVARDMIRAALPNLEGEYSFRDDFMRPLYVAETGYL